MSIMSEVQFTQLLAFLGVCFTAYMNYKMAQLGKKVDTATVTIDKTKALVDGAKGTQLALNANVTKQLALVEKTPENIEAATRSQQLLDDHLAEEQKIANNRVIIETIKNGS